MVSDTKYVVDPSSMTFEAILNDLVDYVSTLPDSKKWLDYFKFSEGATLMELMAGIASFLRYHALMTDRESSPLTARLKSSIYGMADLFGYPVNRSQAPVLQLVINSEVDDFLGRDDPIATLAGQPVSLLKSQQINRGINTVDVAIGRWVTKEATSNSARSFAEFKWRVDSSIDDFLIEDIDQVDNNLVEITVNDQLVSWTRYVESLGVDADVILKTLAYSISIMFGGENIGRTIANNDVVRLKYFAVAGSGLSRAKYDLENLSFDRDGMVINKLTIVTPYYPSDSLQKIVRLLPGYFAAQRRMLNRDDHAAMLMSYPGIISAKWVYGTCTVDGTVDMEKRTEAECKLVQGSWTDAANQCCTATMAYLFDDEHKADVAEEERIFQYLDPFNIGGESIELIKGKPVMLTLRGSIVILDGYDADDITTKIKATIDLFCRQLGINFKLQDLETRIRAIDGVKYVYLNAPVRDLRLGNDRYLKRGVMQIKFTNDESQIQYVGQQDINAGFSL